ncbi:hypothetical protein M514_05899 [Trichuris suis]|uniref:UBC core domain-containing protein n=1 Tax=Trichuris suis TaxID=68888 RepID=A0A085MU13_9BILA|nr:hypothetical protein M514_05899 [Trichuris suis]
MQDEPCGAHHDDIFKWDCAIRGPSDSPWEGGLYKIRVEFPENYPAAPTICTVDPPLFHPNVFPNGKVCLSILHPEGWNPSFGVRQILEGSQRGRSRVAEGFANFQGAESLGVKASGLLQSSTVVKVSGRLVFIWRMRVDIVCTFANKLWGHSGGNASRFHCPLLCYTDCSFMNWCGENWGSHLKVPRHILIESNLQKFQMPGCSSLALDQLCEARRRPYTRRI